MENKQQKESNQTKNHHNVMFRLAKQGTSAMQKMHQKS